MLLAETLCTVQWKLVLEIRNIDLLQQVIDFSELEEFLSSYNLLLTNRQLEEILQEIDTDRTNTVDFFEALKVGGDVFQHDCKILNLFPISLQCVQRNVWKITFLFSRLLIDCGQIGQQSCQMTFGKTEVRCASYNKSNRFSANVSVSNNWIT